MARSFSQRLKSTHDLLGTARNPLDVLFAPQSIAVIGATEREGSVGQAVFKNLVNSSFGGDLYPVNLKRRSVLGIKAYTNVRKIPKKVELAIVVTPATSVPGVIAECGEAGIRGAIIISAGFRETGKEGENLERKIFEEAQKSGIRILGPNCLGVMRPVSGLNATFARNMAKPGRVAFISQSGALCTAILDWSLREEVGFSAFISVGSMLDIGWGDLIDSLADDSETESILIYMESIGNARSFLSAAREVALTKPVIVMKAGYTAPAAKAAASHTGAMTGSDQVLDAAFRRCGVLRVREINDLFQMAEVLAKQPRPKGAKLIILTNAGGPGVLATDALISTGGELAPLSEETLESLNLLLPPHWSRHNPIDILGDASAETFGKAIEIAAKDPNGDGLLAILAPQEMTDPTKTAEQVSLAKMEGKPILASWMGGENVDPGRKRLNHAGIPTFSYPDSAARTFNYMWQYSNNLRALYETPSLADEPEEKRDARSSSGKIIQKARLKGRNLLTTAESLNLFSSYGIPVIESATARNEEKAVQMADKIGYPVVLKLHSETITHKSDVGGVKLNLNRASAVRSAYRSIRRSVEETNGPGHFLGVSVQPMIREEGIELILGSTVDSQMGPVLLFGAGGTLVEIFEDHALGLPPLNSVLARRMMEKTRIYTALKGVRGKNSVNLSGLEQILVRFSRLIVEQRAIREIEINPFFASDRKLIALDARVVIQAQDAVEEGIPQLAIRPYPVQYCGTWRLKDGTPLLIRPIRPEDEPFMRQFNETLSEQTVYYRYFQDLKLSQRIAHERLTRLCFIDYDREMVLVAELGGSKQEGRRIIGACRMSRLHGRDEAEFSVLISDPFQRRGLGTELLNRLLQIERDEKIKKVRGDILPENVPMQKVCRKLGFRLQQTDRGKLIHAEIDL